MGHHSSMVTLPYPGQSVDRGADEMRRCCEHRPQLANDSRHASLFHEDGRYEYGAPHGTRSRVGDQRIVQRLTKHVEVSAR